MTSSFFWHSQFLIILNPFRKSSSMLNWDNGVYDEYYTNTNEWMITFYTCLIIVFLPLLQVTCNFYLYKLYVF